MKNSFKYVKKASLIIVYLIILLFLIILVSGIYVAQKGPYTYTYKEIYAVKDYSILTNDNRFEHANYVRNVPDQYLKMFDIVSYAFPELKDEDIVLEFDKISTTMQARPTEDILVGERKYKIVINNDENFEGIHFDDIPFNAQIGIIAHEFCHILDYSQKTVLEIMGTGVDYMSDAEKREYEREIDMLTIKKGLGYQIRDWAQFAMFESTATDEYKQFKKDFYLNPKEIDSIIQRMKLESSMYHD